MAFEDHRPPDMVTCSCCFIISGVCQPLPNIHYDHSVARLQSYHIWYQAASAPFLLVYASHFWTCILTIVLHNHSATRWGCRQLPLHFFKFMQTTPELTLPLQSSVTIESLDMDAESYCSMFSGVCQPPLNMHCDHSSKTTKIPYIVTGS